MDEPMDVRERQSHHVIKQNRDLILEEIGADPKLMEVELLPSGKTYFVEEGKTILEAAFDAGVKLPYGCAVGTCGSCKCKLVEGDVQVLSDFSSALSAEDLENGYILTCQSRPRSRYARLVVPDAAASGMPERRETQAVIVDRVPLTHDIQEVKMKLDEADRKSVV